MKSPDQFKEKLNELAERFTVDEIIGGELTPLLIAETQCSNVYAVKFKPFQIYADSYFSFLINTYKELGILLADNNWPKPANLNYVDMIFQVSITFRTLRAAMNVSLRGYPAVGFSLLRDGLERALVFSAVLQGIVQRDQAWPRPISITDEEFKKTKKHKKSAERASIDWGIGGNSGLQQDVQSCLGSWREMFNSEVHGANYTHTAEHHDWLKGGKSLTLLPRPNDLVASMCMTSFCAVTWMWLRILSQFESDQIKFGERWLKDWFVLDEVARGFCIGDQRPMLKAISELVLVKFDFVPSDNHLRAS